MTRFSAVRFAAALAALAAAATICAAPMSAQDTTSRAVRKPTAAEDLLMFSQVLNQIRVNHPDSLDTHELLLAAIQGMVSAADPHSFIIPAVRLQPGKESQLREGRLLPVPVSFGFVGGAPVVVSVAAGTAASHLDILPGDQLIAADGKPIAAMSEVELEIALAGPKNSDIALRLERRRLDGTFVQLDRMVRRERADAASAIPAAMMLDASTGYVRITTFVGDKIDSDLRSALAKLEGAGMTQLVLDLRANGGGSVREAADVAGEFLPKGAIVYTAEGRKAEIADTGRVQRSFWRSERRYPMVVMIDEGTASASELVAGALQDHDRALIYGRPSFGKSLLMVGFPLSDGSVIELVIGRIKTPCGRVVQREYRSISRNEYYRQARAARDTAGRPSCKTDGGRTVYGGGGIYPDVVGSESGNVPLWYSRMGEQQLVLSWAGGFVSSSAMPASLDEFLKAPALPATAIADFRTYAERQGVVIPVDTAADQLLTRVLTRAAANAKWGDAGSYRAAALLDPAVQSAVRQLPKAAQLAGVSK